mmetsp:Transcript_30010/g.62727  ORF Transcript_30010/g.62727 Transcript_30010/m.62727 type:complete len:462 (+) Transcript_30010:73-1458(+)
MRKGLSSIRISSSPHPRKRIKGRSVRALFLTLVLAGAGLSLLAVYLSVQIQYQNNPGTTTPGGGGIGSGVVSNIPINVRPDSALSVSQVSKSKANRNTDPSPNNSLKNSARAAYPNGPKNDAKYAKDRVYCMVPYVWNQVFYDVIMKTWGKRCDVINFITDSVVKVGGEMHGDLVIKGDDISKDPNGYKLHTELPPGSFPDNVHFINMTRPWTGCKDKKTGKPKICRHIWEKMWQSWIYVGDNRLDQAEWFCKVDYDTYFFPENLQHYVRDIKNWDPINEHHYFGALLYHQNNVRHSFVAGAAACWSRKTLAGIVDVYKNMPKGYQGRYRGRCEDRPEASEEISTSLCLKEGLNVTAEAMVDDEMREYVTLDPYHNVLTWNRTKQGEWWFWLNKPANAGQMENCCAIRPMGMHKYKNKWQIEMLEEQFYGPTNNKEITKLNERTRRYVDKVRGAMEIDQYL